LFVIEKLPAVSHLPQKLRKTAYSKAGIHAFEHKAKPIFGLQFHPEYATFTGEGPSGGIWAKLGWRKSPRYSSQIAQRIIGNFYHSPKEFYTRVS
jgi:GMP synthase-like glutamine amidotransferase